MTSDLIPSITKLFIAALLGSFIGAEREYRSKSAGFRTMIAISVGSCFFTMISAWISINTPDRIASTIVTGIGFLGAGVIFKGENRVNGITTAATIWIVAAIGMGVGAGHYYTSSFAALMILFILAVLPYFEKKIDKLNQVRFFSLECPANNQNISHIKDVFTRHHIEYKISGIVKTESNLVVHITARGKEKNLNEVVTILWHDEIVRSLKY